MISPILHHLQPELDPHQQAVVGHLEGPLLVIAGPGAGKTGCLVWRAVNLLLLGQASPADLVMCTFSKRAARELRQRFDAAARQAGCPGDRSAVRVATVHSLCRRILRQHPQAAGLKPNFDLLDEFAQLDLLNARFHRVFGPDRETLFRHGWRAHGFVLKRARRYFERVAEEGIDPIALADADDPFHAAVGRCCLRYEAVLQERGALDLSRLQVKADALLQDDDIARSVGAGIRHLMVDEYQDTSHVQERILLRLAETHGNLAVVGDDDQSIYRFRGASVRNLLEFPERFPKAKVLHLTVNYRSHSGIVSAVDRWMAADWSNPQPDGRPFRHPKNIEPDAAVSHADYPSVIAVSGDGPDDEVHRLAEFLHVLQTNGVITDYSQVALLLHSVREDCCERYLSAFADAGIPYHHAPAASGRKHPASGDSGYNGADRQAAFPTDRVLVTTIHQSKGLEWPVVVVASLDGSGGGDEIGRELGGYNPRPPFEPVDRVPDFDAMRRHYVSFSRARNLLVLTAGGPPAPRFGSIWNGLPRWPNLDFAALVKLLSQRFESGAARRSAAATRRPGHPPRQAFGGAVQRVIDRPPGL